MIICCGIFPANAFAGLVRVSDYTVNEFCNEYNRVANNVTKNYIMVAKGPILAHNGVNYDNYAIFCGYDGNGVLTILGANKQGHVSGITIAIPMDNENRVAIGVGVLKNIMIVLGLPEIACGAMLEEISNGINPTARYCYSTQRYVIMKAFFDKASGVFNLDLYGSVD